MRKNVGYSRTEMLDRKFMEKLLEDAKIEASVNPSIRATAEVATLTRIVAKLKP